MQVREHEGVVATLEQIEGVEPVVGRVGAEADGVQLVEQDGAVDGVVLGDEHEAALPNRVVPTRRRPARHEAHRAERGFWNDQRGIADGQRQDEAHRRAPALRTLHRHLATHQVGEPLTDHETETRSSVTRRRRRLGLRELLEQPALLNVGETDAGVGDAELDGLHPVAFADHVGVHFDAADVGELDGVGQEVADDLADAEGVADVRHGELRVEVWGRKQQTLRRGGVHERLDGGLDDAAQLEVRGGDLELAGFDLREVERVADDLQQRGRRALRGADHLSLLAGQVALGEHFQHSGQADHRGADLVRHRRQERRLGPARLDGRPLGPLAGRNVGFHRGRHRVEGVAHPLQLRHPTHRRTTGVVAVTDPLGGPDQLVERAKCESLRERQGRRRSPGP